GLIAPAADVIEQNGEYGGGSNENGKLAPLNVLAGQVYVMMLDNWDANTTTFQLNWNLTNGATLDCTPPLPVTMSSFVNTCVDGKTLLKWTTETETNNDYFAIEKSDEKFQFYEIGRVSGNGNSNVTNSYSFVDDFYNDKTAYYRIKQVDYNGEFMYHRIIASSCFKDEFEVVNQQLMANSLDLIINSVQDEKILVQLFDIHGKLIVESSEQLKLGNNKITLDNFNINSGIYLVNLVGEIHHYQNKLFRK
ncbi:MAG TPA: T9SS type A sorting domain-containing protein, partial [Vicingus sp.]|nr:T9SS type A sorting domain-containing protein [Vicingus sp.]